jgi:murein DD-endopeptidase MepM/ murein hydrolase activator NlpD
VTGEWFVVPDRTGHHRIKHGAAFAHDLVIRKRGRSYSGTGKRLEDHYAWSQPIVAQADGIVLTAADQSPDMPIGQSGGFNNANYVAVYYGAGIQGFYGHIQQKSLKVKVGQRVKKGQTLALVGNSGASGLPHLHFTMTDMSSFSVKGRFTYELRRGTKWLQVNAKDLPPNQIIRSWDPPAATSQPR